MAIGLVYWLVVTVPQRGRAWLVLDVGAPGDPAAEPATSASTAGTA